MSCACRQDCNHSLAPAAFVASVPTVAGAPASERKTWGDILLLGVIVAAGASLVWWSKGERARG